MKSNELNLLRKTTPLPRAMLLPNTAVSFPLPKFTTAYPPMFLLRITTTPNTTALITPTSLKASWILSIKLFKPRCVLKLLLPLLACLPINFLSSKLEIWLPKITNSCWPWTRALRRKLWLRLSALRSHLVLWTKKALSASQLILARSASEITNAEKRSDLCLAIIPSTTSVSINGSRPRPSRARCAKPLWKYFSRSKSCR